ncbi:hypothetical protein [Propionivibrio sp.]|uniref:hypothetical protein n=1 Tax=Propionivibrio sp. TaxID=2212460 RepID=UPI003BF0ABCB
MSSNPMRQSRGGYEVRRLNTVLDEFPVLSATHFICGEPRWVGTLRRGLLLVAGFGIGYFATSAPTISLPISLLLWAVAGVAILFAIRPSPASIYYASDPKGVYFPSRQRSGFFGPARPQTWLLVPWSNITRICVQLLLNETGNTKGVTFCLRVSEEDWRVYFSGTAMLKHGEKHSVGEHQSLLVGFPGEFKSPHEIASLLRSYQCQKTESRPPPMQRSC